MTDASKDWLATCLGVTADAIKISGTMPDASTSYYATTEVVGFKYSVNGADAVSLFIGDSTKLNDIPTNSAPTLSGVPTSVNVAEDVQSNVDLSAATFADADDNSLTVTISTTLGKLYATSSGNVTVSGSASTSLSLTGLAADINTYLDTASNITYTTATDGSGNGYATLTIQASDGTESLASDPTVTINATSTPDVTGVTSSTANGYYNAGDAVSIQVTFDEAVTVSGTPTLTLETGATDRAASYTSGSTSNTLNFTYTVQAGDTSADLDYTATTALAGTIKNSGNYAADLTLASPGATGSLGANKAIVIDTTNPVVTDAQISLSGATGTGGVFKVGDTVKASWNASSGNGDTNLSATLGSVSVNFSAFGGGSAVAASLSSSTWSATYTIASTSTTGANLNVSVKATDAAGNTTTTTDTSNATVDAIVPIVTDANISISGATGTEGTFKIGDTVTATWNNTEGGDNNTDLASVTVDFSQFGGGIAVSASNSSGTWTATYIIAAGAIDATSRNVSVTAVDTAGNATSSADATNAIVDNVAPSVVDGDIAVTGGTGPSDAFKAGDTVTVAWTANNTDTIDVVKVDFSDFGGGASVTATESNGVWTATFDLSAGSLKSSSLELSVTAYDDAGNLLVTTKATVYTANTLIPTVEVSGPTEVVTTRFSVAIEFNEDVSSDLIASELRIENGSVVSVSAVAGSSSKFTADIDPVLGQTVLVQVLAGAVTNSGGNPNTASNEFTVLAGSPADEFEKHKAEIKRVITDDATRSLRSALASNRRMVTGARGRFISQQAGGDTASMSQIVPFDISGKFDLGAGRLSTSGTFFGQTGDFEGRSRRLVFGDFDVQHDSATGSTTATVNGKVAWERKTSDKTMLGYFIGGELAHSSLDGSFTGEQDRVGVSVGGYAVHQLAANIYADGFVSIGAGRNNLDMANDVLALTSDYTTRTATLGGALSGVYTFAKYEFRPELAFSYGKTWIGNVGFTGQAYGLVDDTLSLDAGNVTIANLTLRPEVIWALDATRVANSNAQLSFAPRLVCERATATTTTQDCGAGAELGLTGHSADGLRNAAIRVIVDRVGGSTRSSVAVNLQHRF
ncbi:hypothetical protein [Thioclava sp. A2]|uniref:beta strand repeat-containing protein n=1 Tax=Thioclava sp. FCG-A2 TaxID=3080562 RepID=UPI002952A509|nr:hypothetical protein [Thioclava sp. A2]